MDILEHLKRVAWGKGRQFTLTGPWHETLDAVYGVPIKTSITPQKIVGKSLQY